MATLPNSTAARNAHPILLRMNKISKAFPGVQALQDVSIEVAQGEVLAIVGENGAGKSTLIKILGGIHAADSGQIELDGERLNLDSPRAALAHGIGIIHQEFNLLPFLSIRENLFLGRPKKKWGFVDATSEYQITRDILGQLNTSIDPETPVASLSIAQQQIVEIAKSLITDVRVLVMDEPTATLSPLEVDNLRQRIKNLSNRGIGIIYISHRLEEVLDLADRVAVLRDGQLVAQRDTCETDRQQLIEWMVGRPIEDEFPKQPSQLGDPLLKVKNLNWQDRIHDVSFEVRTGEVLGITGLMGAGRTELAHLLAGITKPDSGKILLDDRPVSFNGPRQAIEAGICLLTEDRKNQGLVLQHGALDNFGLPNLDRYTKRGWLHNSRESKAYRHYIDQLQIKVAGPQQKAGQLSGGNQQKLVLAKWLERDCRIIIIDEPTRGIDIGAKYEIYLLINQLVAQGKLVILISSELPEILGLSDRIIVMREGRIAGIIPEARHSNQSELMELAAQ